MSQNILDFIGNTPLIEIERLNPDPEVKIYAKLEYMNPGGSIKDRIALAMIEAGEKSGELTHDKIIIEATSGNTGIGLALVCAVKGYRLLLTMSEAVSKERRIILKARGAEILLTPGRLGTDGAIEEAYRLVRENPGVYFMTDQYNNKANWLAHYNGTAQEILKQTNGEVSVFVATMGTSGTLMGVSRRLKEYNKDIQIVGVEPYLGHKIQGLKNMKEAYSPEIFNKKLLDKKVNVEDEEAFEMARLLAKKEGLFVGMSSGAAMAIAQKEAAAMTRGKVVVIFPDGGERYLSTSLFAETDKTGPKFFNTLSRSKEQFVPLSPGKASVYSCGPTANARIGLGESRRFVFADLVCRYLEFRGYSVNQVVNITDMDDKTILGSEKENMELPEFTQKHIDLFFNDLKTLKVKPASKYPRVSEHVDDMVALAEKLAQKGFAYEKLHSLYFDISRFSDYGKLSGVDINKIKLGATVDLDEYEKDNPRDFTLFKRTRLSELKRGIYVKTAWGNVRPSWHIQCAAISMKCLGENFDIHTSSRELMFPHHENQIAIASALTGKPMANYWLHCERVLANGKKIDENALVPITLDQLVKQGCSGRVIRFWLISVHYRKIITFSESSLKNAQHSLKRLDACVHALLNIKEGSPFEELDQLLYDIKQSFTCAMDDDLNISAVMVSVFKNIKKINILLSEKKIDPKGAKRIINEFKNIDSVLKIFDFRKEETDSEIERLIKERDAARKEKNWALADKLRHKLRAAGIVVKDKKRTV